MICEEAANLPASTMEEIWRSHQLQQLTLEALEMKQANNF